MNMTVGNALFKKRASHLATCESCPSKTQVDCLVRRNQRKFFKDIKVLPSEEFITQHNSLVYGFNIRKVKDPGETEKVRTKEKDLKTT